MSTSTKNNWRILWGILPIAIGVFVVMMMAGNKKPPTKLESKETQYAVRTIVVPKVTLTPMAEGYGSVKPAQTWTAVAQVSGRIVEMHTRLRDGEILPKGSLLYRIDPIDYELSLVKAETELAELEIQEKNTQSSLNLELRNLNLAEREFKRLKGLSKQGNVSISDVDNAERNMLASRTPVQNLRNTLALIPVQKKLLDTKIKQAQRDLSETQIYAPFNLRVANLSIEKDQYVSKGQNLFEGDSVERVEVIAQVAMSSLRNLFVGHTAIRDMSKLAANIAEFASFNPIVRLDMGNHIAQWQAEFVRFTDSIDAETRTIGVVVAIDKPFEKTKPGIRPPLSKGMFVQVILLGKAQAERLIIPRNSVRGGQIMLVDSDSRLKTKKVDILYNQMDISVVQNGLKEGQELIISDLLPAVDGMLLHTIKDEKLQQQLIKSTGGFH